MGEMKSISEVVATNVVASQLSAKKLEHQPLIPIMLALVGQVIGCPEKFHS